MKLVVLPALIPDIERVYDIYFAAFKNELMAQLMLKILFPGGIDENFRKGHTANTLAFWHISTYQYTLKCVDTESGDIVGMGLGDIHIKERSVEERKNFGVPWLEGAQRERAEKVLNPLWEIKEKLWGGRPYIYIHVIAVSPEHQGKYVGVALIKWGIEMSENSGLPIYCESSPTTFKMYQKFGFKVLKEKLIHSKEVLGTEEDIEVPLMVRLPTAAGQLSFEEWRELGYPSWENIPITNTVVAEEPVLETQPVIGEKSGAEPQPVVEIQSETVAQPTVVTSVVKEQPLLEEQPPVEQQVEEVHPVASSQTETIEQSVEAQPGAEEQNPSAQQEAVKEEPLVEAQFEAAESPKVEQPIVAEQPVTETNFITEEQPAVLEAQPLVEEQPISAERPVIAETAVIETKSEVEEQPTEERPLSDQSITKEETAVDVVAITPTSASPVTPILVAASPVATSVISNAIAA